MQEEIIRRIEKLEIDRWFSRAFYAAGAIMFLCIAWLACKSILAVDSLRALAGQASSQIQASGPQISRTAGRLDRFSEQLLTADRVKMLDQYVQTQAIETLTTTRATMKVANALERTVTNEIDPTIATFRQRMDQQFQLMFGLTAEAHRQIRLNGNSVRDLLVEGKTTIVATRQEVVAVLQELWAGTKGLAVLTNDPALKSAIEDLAASSYETKMVAGNVRLITEDLAGVSNKYLGPLYKPQQRSFFGKLGNGAIKVLRIAHGTGAVVYLIGQF